MKRSKKSVKGIYYDQASKTYSLDVIATIDHCPAHIYELGLATLKEAKKRLKETKESRIMRTRWTSPLASTFRA